MDLFSASVTVTGQIFYYYRINFQAGGRKVASIKYVDKKLNNLTDDKMKQIAKLVSEINYGSITLIIQDGVLVQIDKNEKIRIR